MSHETKDEKRQVSPSQPKRRGRPKGSKNKRTLEVEAIMRPNVPQARKRLKDMLASDDEELAFKAASLVFGYVYGKPREKRELSGPAGEPVSVNINLGG